MYLCLHSIVMNCTKFLILICKKLKTVVMAYVWCLYAFQELNKQTKPGHPDKKGLEKALAAVQVGVDVHQYFQNVRER